MSAVFVILLMFCAVIVMVIRVDNNREKCAACVYRFECHEKLDSHRVDSKGLSYPRPPQIAVRTRLKTGEAA